jgi:hypothetical protein
MPITPDDDLDTGEIDTPDEAPPPSQGFTEMVRESPVAAVVGAFVAGFLVSRLL